ADSDTRANASLRERIQSAIYNDLTQKGVAFVENEDEADLQVTYTVGRRDQLDLDYYPNMVATPYYGIGYSTHIRGYYAGYDPSYWSQEVSARMYTEGTLTIDMFDRRAQKSVWTGMGSRPIDDKDRVNPGPVVDQVVKEILSDYPPAD
ncbi:MAG: DUF4136 domain-containing protein, partial [Oricola sp.]|nr:DUF4136 domain-containing protein [Oricola sp.]